MIVLKLSPRTERLRPLLKEMMLYSKIENMVLEIGPRKTKENSIFVNETECRNLAEVVAQVADNIYREGIHGRDTPTFYYLDYGPKAGRVASVVEKTIGPTEFFSLRSATL